MRFRRPGDRDPYLEVCEAARLSIERATQHRLGGGALKLLLAIHHHLTMRSKTWDYVSYAQLANVAKIHRRSAIRLLPELVAVGAVRHEPGGPKELSIIKLPVVTKPQHQPPSDGNGQRKLQEFDGILHEYINGLWEEVGGDNSSSPGGAKTASSGGDKNAI